MITATPKNRFPLKTLLSLSVLTGVVGALGPAQTLLAQDSPPQPRVVGAEEAANRPGTYDSERFVKTFREKVSPLKHYMTDSRKKVERHLAEAGQRLAEDDLEGSIDKSLQAMDAVTEHQYQVERKLYEAQEFLVGELGEVRMRLATHLENANKPTTGQIDENAGKILRDLAKRAKQETDPRRKAMLEQQGQRLAQIAQTKAMVNNLDPRRQKMWMQMLELLEQMHAQLATVSFRTEMMFQKVNELKVRMGDQRELLATTRGMWRMLEMFDELEQELNDPEMGGLGGIVEDLVVGAERLDQHISTQMDGISSELNRRQLEREAANRARTGDPNLEALGSPQAQELWQSFMNEAEPGDSE
jgi:hypothetical protein